MSILTVYYRGIIIGSGHTFWEPDGPYWPNSDFNGCTQIVIMNNSGESMSPGWYDVQVDNFHLGVTPMRIQ